MGILAGMQKVQHDDLRVLQPQLRLPSFVLLGEFLNPKCRLHTDRICLTDKSRRLPRWARIGLVGPVLVATW